MSWIDASNVQPSATSEQLRKSTGVIVLHRGIPVTGRVVDQGGRVIAGASVRLGDHSWDSGTTTDALGHFRIANSSPRETLLTVQAPGHATGIAGQ